MKIKKPVPKPRGLFLKCSIYFLTITKVKIAVVNESFEKVFELFLFFIFKYFSELNNCNC